MFDNRWLEGAVVGSAPIPGVLGQALELLPAPARMESARTESVSAARPSAASWAPDSPAPRHCGTSMEWKSPSLAAVSAHTFETPDEPVNLPPLWRCRCGFQLDGVVHTSEALADYPWQAR